MATSLLAISCVDGFLKNTHGNTIFYILKDVALLAILTGVVVTLSARPWEKSAGHWHGLWAWQLYFAYLAVQVLNPTFGLAAGFAGFRALALFSLLFLVGAVCFTSTKRLAGTVNVAIVWMFIAAAAGIFQSLAPETWNAISPGLAAASHKYTDISSGDGGLTTFGFPRAYGTLVDPAALGLACCVGFLLAAGALARSRGIVRAWFAFTMVVFGVALQLSGSRLALAGLGAGLLMFLILSWPHRSMRVPAIVALSLLLVAIPLALKASGGDAATARLNDTSMTYAAMTRTRSRNIVLASILPHPFGLGLGATGAGGRENVNSGDARIVAVDNVYWATLYQSGIFGLAVFLVLQGTIIVLAIRWARSAKSVAARATYISLASFQAGLLVSGFWTQGPFEYAPVTQIFWLLAGAVALPKRVEGDIR